jgi:GT2 family glycosyltransferase
MKAALRDIVQIRSQIGLVLPTVYSRPGLLPMALASILNQSPQVHLIVSAPKNVHSKISRLLPKTAVLVAEPKDASLADKINAAINELPDTVKYIGWLGDDDLLHPAALEDAMQILSADPEVVLVFGGCDYIDPLGRKIGTNKSGPWAATILGFGPDLIPQPGALWRRDVFERVGGLNSEFELAFDYDLFLNLKSEGSLVYLPRTLASFRWHPDSLSVKKRWKSVLEASTVRRNHYKGLMRVLWPLWEPWVIGATWLAGKALSLRLRGAEKSFSNSNQ